MMGTRTRLLRGLAQLIDLADLAVYKPTGSYASNEIGVTFHAVPQQPDGIVTLSTFPVSDDITLSDSVIGVQIRVRRAGASVVPANDLADELFDLFHGMTDVELPSPDDQPGVYVVSCERRSGVSGGQDKSNRWSDIQNFYVTIHAPSAHRE